MHASATEGPSDLQKELAAKLVFGTRWSEEAYLTISELNQHVEYSDGCLVIHEMPAPEHQRIVRNLVRKLQDWSEATGAGEVLFAPMPVQLWPGKFREPDVVFYTAEHRGRIGERFAGVPDLAVEVISRSTELVDREDKAVEYARAGVAEYWIVDPEERSVSILVPAGDGYREAARIGIDDALTSDLLPNCSIALRDVFPEDTGA